MLIPLTFLVYVYIFKYIYIYFGNFQNVNSHNNAGTSVEVFMNGKRQLKLLNHGETYILSSPHILVKFIPPRIEWTGPCTIRCLETGLEAELSYGKKSFLGFRGNPRLVKGKIFDSSSSKPLFEIGGQWDR